MFKKLLAVAVPVAATLFSGQAMAGIYANGAFTRAQVSWLQGNPANAGDWVESDVGALSESQISSTYWSGLETAFASADLASGQLKVQSGGSGTYINSSATASFGDTFSFAAANGAPYIWQAGSTVKFTFHVDGSTSQSESTASMLALDPTGFSLLGQLNFVAYQPGFYALQEQADAIYALPDWWSPSNLAILNQIQADQDALRIHFDSAYLHPSYYDGVFENFGNVLSIPAGGLDLDFEFSAGGSFEWLVNMATVTRFDPGTGSVYELVSDYSHTATASFSGPAEAIVYSASGMFPGTSAVSPVPEAGTFWLSALGVISLVWFKSAKSARRQCSA